MSALVRTIRKAILGTAADRNQVLKEALEELGIEAGQTSSGAMRKLQRIILNSGRDDEVQLRRALTGLNLTGGAAGGGEARRIKNALLRSGRESELRSAIDDLITLGGGGPEWVPDGAVIHIDLINDRAWTEDDGEVNIDTLLGADENTQNESGESGYDPAGLTANGYSQAEADDGFILAYIGAARTKVLAGSTFVVRWYGQAEGGSNVFPVDFCSAPASNTGLPVRALTADRSVSCNDYSSQISPSIASIVNLGAASINQIALTVTPTRFEMSVNGSVATDDDLNATSWPPSGADQIVAVIAWSGVDSFLQTIAIYDALPSTAGLSTLSTA